MILRHIVFIIFLILSMESDRETQEGINTRMCDLVLNFRKRERERGRERER